MPSRARLFVACPHHQAGELLLQEAIPVIGRDEVPAEFEHGRPVDADPHMVRDEHRVVGGEAAGGDTALRALHHRAQRVPAILAVLFR